VLLVQDRPFSNFLGDEAQHDSAASANNILVYDDQHVANAN